MHLRIAHVIGLWSQSWVWPVDAWTITLRTVHCISVRGRNCSVWRGRLHAVVGIALCSHRDKSMFHVHVSFHKRDMTLKLCDFIRVRRGSTVTDLLYVLIFAVYDFRLFYWWLHGYEVCSIYFSMSNIYFSMFGIISVCIHYSMFSVPFSVIPFPLSVISGIL